MIHYSLICVQAHEFDGWFRDSSAFDAQAANGSVHCPFCQSNKVAKAPMAPHVARGVSEKAPARQQGGRTEGGKEPEVALLDERHAQLRGMIRELRETVLAVAEDVGESFPKEARKIHDGDAPERPIRGRASFAEAKALLDEGIDILALPPGLTGDGN
ncbi:MAG: DUF1178 family protein [Methylocystis sp.]